MSKSSAGRFFEDFRVGQAIKHATPRTITAGDVALYTALTGSRFALPSSDTFAAAIGYSRAPVDDLLVFNMVLGKTVPDISLNAVAELGSASGRFLAPVYPGDTLTAASEIIGAQENLDRRSGTLYVRTIGLKQDGAAALDYVRWLTVRKRDHGTLYLAPEKVPALPHAVEPGAIGRGCPALDLDNYDHALSGSAHRFDDYAVGERIDHVDAVTAEHGPMADRLYQVPGGGDASARPASIPGAHVMALARALTFNGLANAFHVAAINGARHVAPLFAGDAVRAWSAIVARAQLPGRRDVGALRLRTVATRNRSCADFPDRQDDTYDPAVILDLDYWVLIPR
jgi:2-methylfumaryl-CoA hydratase